MESQNDQWMQMALEEAKKAMANGELPIAAILIAGENELGRAQTSVTRMGTLAAHAELMTMLHAKDQLWNPSRPLKIVTTLEPCLMCVGAGMQVGVDEIVFGMRAGPDGAQTNFPDVTTAPSSPTVTGGLREFESLALMRELLVKSPKHSAADYVRAMVTAYEKK